MAAAVLNHRVASAGLADQVRVTSAGTAGWHVGAPADPRARAALRRRGYDDAHRAQRFTTDHAGAADLVLAMDTSNHADLVDLIADTRAELGMFRQFDPLLSHVPTPDPALDVPDPYYGSDRGFDDVLTMIEIAADGLIEMLQRQLHVD